MTGQQFTNPFRYNPSKDVQDAATEVIKRIEADPALKEAFGEGKMLGVLIAKDSSGNRTTLAGFSGNVGSKNLIPGFVPPIFDLLSPDGYFRIRETEISAINKEIENIIGSDRYRQAVTGVCDSRKKAELQISDYKTRMASAKSRRQKLRDTGTLTTTEQERLIRESQFMKAELRRMKLSLESVIREKEKTVSELDRKVALLKEKRQQMSEDLQQWLFRQYVVRNAKGEEKSIHDIFAERGLTPPGGTGECAAPKLLQYAYTHSLEPLEMGEFWYGASPEKEIRVSGHFYPSCQNKCGPLLGFMLQGLEIKNESYHKNESPRRDIPEQRDGSDISCSTISVSDRIIYSDDSIVVCDKPSGMPSVPGKNGMVSLLEILSEKFGTVYTVHRLDMDTSGLIVFARSTDAQKILQTQFASRTVGKTYKARLTPTQGHQQENCTNENNSCKNGQDRNVTTPDYGNTGNGELYKGQKGRIALPLIADINDRPRQMVDFDNGKEAITDFEITDVTPGGIDVTFHPLTGRTHQLRVHSAHPKGLNAPIMGDRLYGGNKIDITITDKSSAAHHDDLLSLQATELSFDHPVSNVRMRFCLD